MLLLYNFFLRDFISQKKTRTIKSLKEDEIPSVSYITIHEKNLNVNCI